MARRPVVCGVDPGIHAVGISILGETVSYSAVIPVPRLGSWATRCRHVHQAVTGVCQRYRPAVLGVEAFTWRGKYATTEPPMLMLIGAVVVVPDVAEVRAIPPQEWQQALLGSGPPARGWHSRQHWKDMVRRAVTLGLAARGIAWDDPHPDPGGHRWDALSVALYVQDLVALEASRPRGAPLRGEGRDG